MTEDPRCCGSGTCIINADGQCWCGQRWNGQKMAPAPRAAAATTPSPAEPGHDEVDDQADDRASGRAAHRAETPPGASA